MKILHSTILYRFHEEDNQVLILSGLLFAIDIQANYCFIQNSNDKVTDIYVPDLLNWQVITNGRHFDMGE